MPQYAPVLIGILLILLLVNVIFLFSELPTEAEEFNPGMMVHDRQQHQHGYVIASFDGRDIHNEQNRVHSEALRANPRDDKARNNGLEVISEEIYRERLEEMERKISKSTGLSSHVQIKSCRLIDCESLEIQKWVFYNPFPKSRILCDTTLDYNGTLIMDNSEPCFQDKYAMSVMFPALPTRQNQRNVSSGLVPVRLGIKGVRPSQSFWLPFEKCDVSCYYLNNNIGLNAITRTIQGTDWEIVTSMEGPMYYKSVTSENEQRPDNLFYATTSLDSEIPMSYFSWDDYAPDGKPVPGNRYDRVQKAAVFMARNCQSKNRREDLVKDLMKLSDSSNSSLQVHSISKCLRNRDPPAVTKADDKNEILGQYMFYFAFENQLIKDYITEKLWASLFRSGTIPVYYGSSNIEDHVPPHSVIVVRNFANSQALWDHLVRVANNQTLYESYHAWRQEPLPKWFIQKYNFTHTHSLCRMCRWAFAKQYGMAWDHEQQSIDEDLILSQRKVCWDESSGLLTRPFRESWFSHNFRGIAADGQNHSMCGDLGCAASKKSGEELCDEEASGKSRSVTLAQGEFRRTVWSHDGVLDLLLEPLTEKRRGIMLHLAAPLLDDIEDRLYWNFIHHRLFWVQSKSSRMTIMTNQDFVVASPTAGAIQMFVTFKDTEPEKMLLDTTLRMRIIIEQIDEMTRNSDGKSELSYFGRWMIQDFLNPIEKFAVLNSRRDTEIALQLSEDAPKRVDSSIHRI